MKIIIILGSALIALILSGCDPLCEFKSGYCFINNNEPVLLITGFEEGKDPTEFLGSLSLWTFPQGQVQANLSYRRSSNDTIRGNYFAQIEIEENIPMDTNKWSGAGMILTFSDCSEGLDFSNFTYLDFDIKTTNGSELDQSRIKLEDADENEQLGLLIRKYGEITTDWKTIRIPLVDFIQNGGSTSILNLSKLVRLVTVSVNQITIPANSHGILQMDNIKFVK